MYRALSPGAIGIHVANLEAAVEAAVEGSFEGVEINAAEVAARAPVEGIESLRAQFTGSAILPAGFGLPFEWRGNEETWKDGLKSLPAAVRAAVALGCVRCTTYILPGSNDRTLEENLQFHADRLQPVAEILANEGCRFGIEYIGTKSLRNQFKHPFLYTAKGMLELAAVIGHDTGLLVDSWHWYTARETVEDLLSLSPEQIVYVHVNDAPAGVPRDELKDGERELPSATGVIPIASFINALRTVGYNGPVVAEPFSAELKQLTTNRAKIIRTSQAMKTILP